MSYESIAVYRRGALGDMVVTFPVLQVLRSRLGSSSLALIAPGDIASIAKTTGIADRAVPSNSPAVDAWLRGDAEAARGIVGDADLLLAYTDDADGRLAEAATAAGVSRVVLHPEYPEEGGDVHATDQALAALDALGIAVRGVAPCIRATAGMRSAAVELLAAAGVDARDGFAVMHIGSSTAAKNWPGMQELAHRLRERLPVRLVLHRGPAEAGDDRIWPGVPSVGPMDLSTLTGLLSLASLYVGNDTGPSHLAAAVGAPTRAVFGRQEWGQTVARVWSPRGENAVAVEPSQGARWPTVDDVFSACVRVFQ